MTATKRAILFEGIWSPKPTVVKVIITKYPVLKTSAKVQSGVTQGSNMNIKDAARKKNKNSMTAVNDNG